MAGVGRGDLAYRRGLVVEDEYVIAEEMMRALHGLGADVVGPVATPDEALAPIETELLDAAVLDVNLGGRPASPVADALRAHGVPFLFATGNDAAAIPAAYRDAPCWEKPFEPEALVEALPAPIEGP